MNLTFDPVLVAIGPLAVRWYGVLAVAGVGLVVWLSLRAAAATSRDDRAALLDALAWGLPVAVLTARVVDVLAWWDYYLTHAGELWQFRLEGLSLWGGLLGGGLVAAARLRSRADPARRPRAFDLVAPYAALGIAIGRLGAFVDGQGQGVPADLPWATTYTSPLSATPDFGVPRHPLALYEAIIAFGLAGLLLRLPPQLPPGVRAAVFLVVWGLTRVALGPLRLEPAFLFGLQLEQLLAMVAVAVGVGVGVKALVARRQPARAGPSPAAAPRSHAADERVPA